VHQINFINSSYYRIFFLAWTRITLDKVKMGNSYSEHQILLNEIQLKTGYTFRRQGILEEALTHDSRRVTDRSLPTYQRLEFLGDSVLQLIITDYLFQKFPSHDEGTMSRMRPTYVCNERLETIAEALGIHKYVNMDKNVSRVFRRFGSFIESILGAIYVDAGHGPEGLRAATACVHRLWKL